MYRISLIISRTPLHETSHPRNGVELTIEMRLTFFILFKKKNFHSGQSHMQLHTLYTPRVMFMHLMADVTYNQVRPIIGEIR